VQLERAVVVLELAGVRHNSQGEAEAVDVQGKVLAVNGL
jgi:hypothetical protein